MSMRRVMAVTALVTSLGLAAPAQADVTPVTKTGWSRWSGADRYATAVAISKATFTQSDFVYVVSGENFPDGLAAGPVAGVNQAPVLLTKRDSVPEVVAAELARLDPNTVIVVGGTQVITDATMDALEAASGAGVVRFAGATRYATAVRLARAMEEVQTAYIASGESFADALAAGPAAGSEYAPLLLTKKDSLPPETRDYLAGSELSRIVIAGGTLAVSSAVEDAIRAAVPAATIIRHAGRDRYHTARKIALSIPSTTGTVLYAPGSNFPDALAATPAAIINGAPLLLTRAGCHPDETMLATDFLTPEHQVAVGGSSVTYAGPQTCGISRTYRCEGSVVAVARVTITGGQARLHGEVTNTADVPVHVSGVPNVFAWSSAGDHVNLAGDFAMPPEPFGLGNRSASLAPSESVAFSSVAQPLLDYVRGEFRWAPIPSVPDKYISVCGSRTLSYYGYIE